MELVWGSLSVRYEGLWKADGKRGGNYPESPLSGSAAGLENRRCFPCEGRLIWVFLTGHASLPGLAALA